MTDPIQFTPGTPEKNMRIFYKWLGHNPDEWTELRAIEYTVNRKGVGARDFVNNEDDFVAFCKRWSGTRHVYAGLNPRKRKAGKTEDIARIIGIPFDVDSENKDDAATEEEKQKAKENAEKFMEWLRSQGYLEPYLDDSGNGYHIVQRVDIPVKHHSRLENQLRNYFKEVQKATPYMKLDSIFDMTRILKVPGTLSLKGENTPERPHRTAKILSLGSKKLDLKLIKHIEEIQFQYEESATQLIHGPKTDKWFLTDKRTRHLKPCQKQFMRKGGTLGVPDAERNDETGLRMNFVRCLITVGFTKKEIVDIFRLFEDFSEEKTTMEVERIIQEKTAKDWSCKAIHKHSGCLGRKCRHYLGSIEYSDITPETFCLFRENKEGHLIFNGFNYPAIVKTIQQVYMFMSTSAKSDIWVYNEATGIWEDPGEEVIKQTCQVWLGKYFKSTCATEVVKQILFGNYMPNIFKDVQRKNRNYIVMENGIYNLETDHLENFDPYLYAINKIPIKYDPKATCPEIEKFIGEIAQPRDTIKLEELPGYCLYKSYTIARIVLLEGKGANGKSTYLNMLNAFLGHENVSHVTIQQILEGGFKSAEMYGKLANVCGDLPNKPLKDTTMVKMLTGEDETTHEKKYRDPFDYYNYAKQVYATNEVPRSWDDTIAFHRRWLIVTFKNIFEEGAEGTDINMIDKITTPEELSGLFNLAVKRLKTLFKRGKFDKEPSTAEKRRLYIKKSNPIHYFAEWFVEKNIESWISKGDLYDEYVALCVKLERTPSDSSVFSKQVRRFLPYIMEYKKTIYEGLGKSQKKVGRIPGWKGIRVLTDKINNYGENKDVIESAFENLCFDCKKTLGNEWYPHGKERFCRKCHLKLEALKNKKPYICFEQSKFTADSKEIFCKKSNEIIDPSQCSPECQLLQRKKEIPE